MDGRNEDVWDGMTAHVREAGRRWCRRVQRRDRQETWRVRSGQEVEDGVKEEDEKESQWRRMIPWPMKDESKNEDESFNRTNTRGE